VQILCPKFTPSSSNGHTNYDFKRREIEDVSKCSDIKVIGKVKSYRTESLCEHWSVMRYTMCTQNSQ
jgi:hypothetical protein